MRACRARVPLSPGRLGRGLERVVCVYIYIYIGREREGKRERGGEKERERGGGREKDIDRGRRAAAAAAARATQCTRLPPGIRTLPYSLRTASSRRWGWRGWGWRRGREAVGGGREGPSRAVAGRRGSAVGAGGGGAPADDLEVLGLDAREAREAALRRRVRGPAAAARCSHLGAVALRRGRGRSGGGGRRRFGGRCVLYVLPSLTFLCRGPGIASILLRSDGCHFKHCFHFGFVDAQQRAHL